VALLAADRFVVDSTDPSVHRSRESLAPGGEEIAMHPDDSETSSRPQTWGQRHAITILTVVLFGMLAFVMVLQVAC
jgi:hypothetical protein